MRHVGGRLEAVAVTRWAYAGTGDRARRAYPVRACSREGLGVESAPEPRQRARDRRSNCLWGSRWHHPCPCVRQPSAPPVPLRRPLAQPVPLRQSLTPPVQRPVPQQRQQARTRQSSRQSRVSRLARPALCHSACGASRRPPDLLSLNCDEDEQDKGRQLACQGRTKQCRGH